MWIFSVLYGPHVYIKHVSECEISLLYTAAWAEMNHLDFSEDSESTRSVAWIQS